MRFGENNYRIAVFHTAGNGGIQFPHAVQRVAKRQCAQKRQNFSYYRYGIVCRAYNGVYPFRKDSESGNENIADRLGMVAVYEKPALYGFKLFSAFNVHMQKQSAIDT